MKKTMSVCEHCANDFEVPANDKAEGQICPECLAKADGVIIRMTLGADDNDPRYYPGLEYAAEAIEDGMVYGSWGEFNNEEYAVVDDDWNNLPSLDWRTLADLQRTSNERMAFMQAFWARHYDILEARDAAMNKWQGIADGTRQKPIEWLKVPDFEVQYSVILAEVK